MLKKIEEEWVAIQGSIFLVKEESVKSEISGQPLTIHQAIAFNVNHKLAEHIVRLHNESLKCPD